MGRGDWQELAQAVLIGLIFSYFVAKLISTVISFREDHLKVVREEDLVPSETLDEPEPEPPSVEPEVGEESLLAEECSDDDWEGIESTELDELFSAATAFVAATAADRVSPKVSTELQLQLYGLYKIATEGPCTVPQPSALKMTARAKWNAWQGLGAMPPEEAMHKYISIVTELYPSWMNASAIKNKHEETTTSTSSAKGPVGPVFSSFVHEEESDNDLKLDAIHVSAREGEADELLKYIENGISVNLRDSEGRTPLHWAVDRGHFNIVEMLLTRNADVNAKDNEGQTALHYAVVCEREAIAELLIKHDADPDVKDEDGSSPSDLCSSSWAFIASAK